MSVGRPGGPLRVVVVDDEAPARRKLQRYLAERDDVLAVGEAGDGQAAVATIRELDPDLILLDVQMPGLDGFEVLARLDEALQARVIFVTAHDEHAVRAFEVAAVDYLLKPVDRDRFQAALDRARERVETAGWGAGGTRGSSTAPTRAAPAITRFLVPERGRLLIVPVDRVLRIGAAGNYVELYTGSATHLVRGTLRSLEERLPGDRFVRIHRSTIVNLNRVVALHPWSHGDFVVQLDDGSRVRLSRRYREALGDVYGP